MKKIKEYCQDMVLVTIAMKILMKSGIDVVKNMSKEAYVKGYMTFSGLFTKEYVEKTYECIVEMAVCDERELIMYVGTKLFLASKPEYFESVATELYCYKELEYVKNDVHEYEPSLGEDECDAIAKEIIDNYDSDLSHNYHISYNVEKYLKQKRSE